MAKKPFTPIPPMAELPPAEEINVQEILNRYLDGEIDLICRDGDTIVFLEVKARPEGRLGKGIAAVHADKRRRIRAAANVYLKHMHLKDAACRFDILEFTRAGAVYMENAF